MHTRTHRIRPWQNFEVLCNFVCHPYGTIPHRCDVGSAMIDDCLACCCLRCCQACNEKVTKGAVENERGDRDGQDHTQYIHNHLDRGGTVGGVHSQSLEHQRQNGSETNATKHNLVVWSNNNGETK